MLRVTVVFHGFSPISVRPTLLTQPLERPSLLGQQLAFRKTASARFLIRHAEGRAQSTSTLMDCE